MSTKESAAKIKEAALKSVINRLRSEQEKLKYSINKRAYEMKALVRKQTQEKREKAELGKIINQFETS